MSAFGRKSTLLILVASTVIFSCSDEDLPTNIELDNAKNLEWSKNTLEKAGKEYLAVNLENTQLKIPSEYVGQNPPNEPFFDVIFLWPDAHPTIVSRSSEKKYDYVRVGFSFSNSGRKEYKDTYIRLEILKEQNKLDNAVQSSEFSPLIRHIVPGGASYYLFPDEKLITPSGNPLVAHCLHEGEESTHFHCEIGLKWSDDLTIRFTFEPHLLPQMIEAYPAITDIIKSFEIRNVE